MKLVLSLIFLTSCTLISSGEAPPSAKGKQYQVRFSSENWDEKSDKRSDYIFINKADGAFFSQIVFVENFKNNL